MTAEDVVEEAIQGTLHEAMDVYIPDCTFVATEVLAALEAAGFVVATRDEIRAMSPSEQAELIGGKVERDGTPDGGGGWYSRPCHERAVGQSRHIDEVRP